MDRILIDFIVEEVVRRIKALQNQKKALVITSRDTDAEKLELVLETLTQEGFQIDTEALETLSSPMKTLISPYHCLVLGNLTIGEAGRFRDFQIGTPRLQMCYEALRQGKTVYAVAPDFEIDPENVGLLAATEPLLNELSSYGLKIIAKRRASGLKIEKKLIALTDVNHLQSGTLNIQPDAVVTVSAKQYLEEKGIVILRK